MQLCLRWSSSPEFTFVVEIGLRFRQNEPSLGGKARQGCQVKGAHRETPIPFLDLFACEAQPLIGRQMSRVQVIVGQVSCLRGNRLRLDRGSPLRPPPGGCGRRSGRPGGSG